MRQVDILFVTPKHTGLMRIVSKTVQAVCGSSFSHVGIIIDRYVFEAVLPQVMMSPVSKYDNENCEAKEVISVQISDSGYRQMRDYMGDMIDQDVKYGYFDCVIAGTSDLFGYRVARFLKRFIGGKGNQMCSGTVTGALKRAGYLPVAGVDIEEVTPQELYSILASHSLPK